MHLSKFYAGMQNKGLSKRTIQYVWAILRKALEDAVAYNLIPYNVADRVKVARPERKDAAVIDPTNLEKVCNAIIEDWLYPFYYLAIATGCRRGELCALRWDDVDWDRPAIRIDESTQELPKAKGGIIYDNPKSKTSRRTVVLPEEAVTILKLQRKLQEQLKHELGDNWQGSNFVFTCKNGHPLRPSTVKPLASESEAGGRWRGYSPRPPAYSRHHAPRQRGSAESGHGAARALYHCHWTGPLLKGHQVNARQGQEPA